MSNINGLKKTYLEDVGISEGTIAWREYLDGQGYSGNSIVQDTKAFLVAQGHWTGNMSESLYSLYEAGGVWTPLELFALGEQGAWYDPSDLSTLFQDAAGTIPVTTDGDPVGYMGDKSGNGNHATQSVSAARPTYRTDGAYHKIVFDGVDDSLLLGTFDLKEQVFSLAYETGTATKEIYLRRDGDNGDYRYLIEQDNANTDAGGDTGRGVTLESLYIDGVLSGVVTRGEAFAAVSGKHTQVWSTDRTTPKTGSYRLSGYLSYMMSGSIFSLVWLSTFVSDSDRADLEVYLASKSGVTL